MLLQRSRHLSTAFSAARRPLISLARRHASSGGASSDSGAAVQRLGLPDSSSKRILLHSCCAPCSGAMVQEMVEAGHDISIFFYNPNIHPKREYEIRKEENKRYAADLGIPFVDADYDTEEWYRRARGMEFDPERGGRCSMCFDMRMERTALHAYEHGFDCFTTTNATSRWKDQQQACPHPSPSPSPSPSPKSSPDPSPNPDLALEGAAAGWPLLCYLAHMPCSGAHMPSAPLRRHWSC